MEDLDGRRKQRYEEASKRLGEALKQIRLNAGMTQQEISDLAGPHKSVVGRIEQGAIKDPGFLTVAELAHIYGVGLNNLARLAGINHVKEIQTDGGWEAVDWRLVEAIRIILKSDDEEWREAITENFYNLAVSKAKDESLNQFVSKRLNELLYPNNPAITPEMQEKFDQLNTYLDQRKRDNAAAKARNAALQRGDKPVVE